MDDLLVSAAKKTSLRRCAIITMTGVVVRFPLQSLRAPTGQSRFSYLQYLFF